MEYAKQQAEQYRESQQELKEFCSNPNNRQYCEEETEGEEEKENGNNGNGNNDD